MPSSIETTKVYYRINECQVFEQIEKNEITLIF